MGIAKTDTVMHISGILQAWPKVRSCQIQYLWLKFIAQKVNKAYLNKEEGKD